MKNAFLADSLRQVRATLNRFFAIMIITALGVAFFAGLRATGPAMRQTGTEYLNEQNAMDVRLISTVGFNGDDFDAVKETEGISAVEGGYSADVLADIGENSPAVRIYSLDGSINRPRLEEGRMPEKANECLVDSELVRWQGVEVGDKVTFLSGTGDPLEDTLKNDTYTVAGIAWSPLYISDDRGSSTVGSGQSAGYFYLPEENFSLDVYTDLYVTVDGVRRGELFEDEYIDELQPVEDALEAIGNNRAATRYTEIKEEAEGEIADAKIEIADGYQELDDAQKEIDDARQELADGKQEYTDNKEKFEQEMADGQAEIDDGWAKYNDGLSQYESGLVEYESGRKTLDDGWAAYNSGLAEYESGLAKFNKEKAAAGKEFAKGEKALQSAQGQYDSGIAALEQGRGIYDALSGALAAGNTPEAIGAISGIAAQISGTQPDLSAVLSAYAAAPDDPAAAAAASAAVSAFGSTLDATEEQLDAAQKEITAGRDEIENGKAKLQKGQEELDAAKAGLDAAKAELDAGEAQSAAGKAQLDSAKGELDSAKSKLVSGESELADGRAEGEQKLSDAEKDIADGEKELADGESEFAAEKVDALIDLSDAEQEVADAEQDLADFKKPEWFVLNNEKNAGFMSYKQDTIRLDAIAVVLPVFFFVLAAFVTMTSMTRLVESDRSYIGTVKSLGYGNGVIALRYLAYAVAASLTGGLLGLALGYNVLPPIIFNTYRLMYTVPDLSADFPFALSFASVAIAVLCAALPAYLVCMNSVHEKPSELMRPESPQSGKRVFLERIPFLWKRLNFLQKVTVRNIFRYKKRLVMTIIGVCGCTALMFAGFAIKDAITMIVPKQYGEVFVYDMQVGYSTDDEGDAAAAEQLILEQPGVSSGLPTRQQAVDALQNGDLVSTTLVVPEDPARLDQYINLHSRQTGETLPLEDGSAVLAERLASLLDVKTGDSVTLRDADGRETQVKVGGIAENYLMHYVYMTPVTYEDAFGVAFEPNQGLYLLNSTDQAEEEALSSKLMETDGVESVGFASDSRGSMQRTVDALYVVVLVLVVSAGALIFVVLFSLITINLEERKRELATLKVLGFNDRELSSYIYRESNILTVIGIVLGLLNGIVLQRYILNTMETNLMMFSRDILWQSFAFAAGLTGLFAVLVNLIMMRHFKKIDMISSLKSVE